MNHPHQLKNTYKNQSSDQNILNIFDQYDDAFIHVDHDILRILIYM